MAKGTSRRGNAHATSTSLTSLLALPVTPAQAISHQVDLTKQLWEQHSEFLNPERQIGLRGYVPEWDDRRVYKPDKRSAKPGSLIRSATRLHIGRIGRATGIRKPHVSLSSTVGFRLPHYVSICLRRKVRREVYLAKTHKKRRGSGAPRRRNFWSIVKC